MVSSTDDSGPATLRQAITDLNALGGGNIVFTKVLGRIFLLSELPQLRANINILGPGTNLLSLGGTNLAYGVAVAPGSTSSIQALSFRGFVSAPYAMGAAVTNAGWLTVTECWFQSNRTTGFGGAIFNSGTLVATRCLFTGNSAVGEPGQSASYLGAGGGGGAGIGGAVVSSGRLCMFSCGLNVNSAVGGDAGYVYAGGQSGGGRGGGPYGGVGGSTNGNTSGAAGGFGSGGGGGLGGANGPGLPCTAGGAGGFGAGGGLGVESYPFGCNSPDGVPGAFGGVLGGGAGLGGAIFVLSGTLCMNNCQLVSNTVYGGRAGGSAAGGGIFIEGGTAALTNCLLACNAALSAEGGARDYGHHGQNAGNALGPGLYLNTGALTAYASSIVSNWAHASDGGSGARSAGAGGFSAGGGLYCDGGAASVMNSTISGNKINSGNSGLNGYSGLYLQYGAAASGGGIFVRTGMASITASTIVYNLAAGGFGVPAALITNVQGAGLGGGIANQSGSARVGNTILWGNVALYPLSSEPNCPDAWGTITSFSNNMIGTILGSTGWAPSDLTGIDPRIGPLANNGGQTPTHALLTGSPAIDAGVNSGLSFDQRGQPRTIDAVGLPNRPGSDGTDIGAVELDPVLRLTSIIRWADDVQVSFTTVSGSSYTVEYQTSLGSPSWIPLSTHLQGTGGVLTVLDLQGALRPIAFYRVRTP